MPKRRSLPPLNALRTFEAFGRHLNLRDTADELCVTESAISRQLKHLEEFLNTKLIERTGRSTRLTALGLEYISTLTTSLSSIDAQTNLLFSPQLPQHGETRLRLGVSPNFSEEWLVHRLSDFHTQHPGLVLEVHTNYTYPAGLMLDLVDVEVITGPHVENDFLEQRLFRMQDFPVCSPSLIADTTLPMSLSALSQLPLLHEGSPHWWTAWFQDVGLKLEDTPEEIIIHDATLLMRFVLLDKGVALGDHISSLEYLRTGQLVRPVQEAQVTDDWVSLLTRPDAVDEPAVRAFTRWLTTEMKIFIDQLPDYRE